MSEAVLAELELIRKANPSGLLDPNDVVAFARSPNTALHSRFEWDDSRASDLYRLEQARKIIRVVVNVLPRNDGEVKVLPVYLSEARPQKLGAGYSRTDEVIADDTRRRMYWAHTTRTARALLARCGCAELDGVIQQLDVIEASLRAGSMKAAG